MQPLGIPVILGLNKQIEAKESYLDRLYQEGEKYLDMIDNYDYIKASNLAGRPESKNMQFPDDMGVSFSLELNTLAAVSEYIPSDQSPEFERTFRPYEPIAIPKIMLTNNSEYTYEIEAIEAKYYVLGGEGNAKQYPLSTLWEYKRPDEVSDEINKAEGYLYTMFNGDLKVAVQSFISREKTRFITDKFSQFANLIERWTLKPGAVNVYNMPKGYCDIMDGSEPCTLQYLRYMQKMQYIKKGAAVDVTVWWKSNNPNNPGGRFMISGLEGSVRIIWKG